MIGKLSGTLLEKNPPQILVDCHGVGYEVDVPMSTFYNLPASGEKVARSGEVRKPYSSCASSRTTKWVSSVTGSPSAGRL